METKEEKRKRIISRIILIVLWLIVIGWVIICFLDYYNVLNGNSPKFCVKNSTVTYDDGSVDICYGLGYKVINYQRDNYNAIEYGPLWIKESYK